MPEPGTKATRRTLDGYVDQTLRLVQATLEAQKVNPRACLLNHEVDLELDNDLAHERTTGIDAGGELVGNLAELGAALPADATLSAGFVRDSQRSGTAGLGGRFKYSLTIPARTP